MKNLYSKHDIFAHMSLSLLVNLTQVTHMVLYIFNVSFYYESNTKSIFNNIRNQNFKYYKLNIRISFKYKICMKTWNLQTNKRPGKRYTEV